MKIIVGLGNPGDEYKNTRHNTGFMAVDYLRKQLGEDDNFSDFAFDKKAKAEISSGAVGKEKVLLAKPQTFMNSSGQAVQQLVNFYKLDSEQDLLLIYDDLDLPLGEIRTAGTSAGGHKGVQSVFDALGTENIQRVRVGIRGESREKIEDAAYYVLQNFGEEEKEKIMESFKDIAPLMEDFASAE